MDEVEKYIRELMEEKTYTESEFITEVYYCLSNHFIATINRDSNSIKVSLPNGQTFTIIIENINAAIIH